MKHLAALILVLLVGCNSFSSQNRAETRRDSVTRTTVAAPEEASQHVIAVGDIASCTSNADDATAALVDQRPGTVITLGDNVYERGTAAEWERCWEPAWGRHKARIRPSPGNHDYAAADGAAYHDYFDVPRYYAFDLGSWRLISLNSNCAVVECANGSAQYEWLRAELAGHRAECTLAYWHHPRFTSGLHGPTTAMEPLYSLLAGAGVDVVLAGHDHHYERIVERGVRHFVVGTGGRSLYPVLRAEPGSEVHDTATYGVLALTLNDGRYEWEFLPAAGGTFSDRGSGSCR